MVEQIIELEITGLTAQGDGLGRHQGLAVFVPGALPGERVLARVVQVKKNYARAMLLELMRQAKERVFPACPFYYSCGGCVLQHLTYEAQLIWKRRWLKDALQRIGGQTVEVLPTLGTQVQIGYRDRVQLHSWCRGNELKLGFYEGDSRNPTESASCILMRSLLSQIVQTLTELPPYFARCLTSLNHVALRCDSTGEQAMLTLVGLEEQKGLGNLAIWLMEQEPRLVSVWVNWGKPVYGIYGDKWSKLAGAEKMPDSIGGLRLLVSPGSFTQINASQARRLYERVEYYAALSGRETVVDAYSGVGAIALYLADKALSVVGIEKYAQAAADAVVNAELNGIGNCRFVTGRVEEVLPVLVAEGCQAQVAVLDPPRAGCEVAVLRMLKELKPQRIIYVSCDPATLARDIRLLCEGGYMVHEAQPLDMFPHTGHVEAIVSLFLC